MNYNQRATLVGILFYGAALAAWVSIIVNAGWLAFFASLGGSAVGTAAIIGVLFWVVQGDKVKKGKP